MAALANAKMRNFGFVTRNEDLGCYYSQHSVQRTLSITFNVE
jgi:hypothetical protein